MVQWLLLLALTPTLLLPPGVCVCHLFDEGHLPVVTANPHLGTAAPTAESACTPVDDPADHPPGCPVRKCTDGQCLLLVLDWVPELPLAAVLPISALAPLTAAIRRAHFSPSLYSWPAAESPLYLTLRALLI